MKPHALDYYCARCKYPFEAMKPPECPLCGTQDVEPCQEPLEPDEKDDDDG